MGETTVIRNSPAGQRPGALRHILAAMLLLACATPALASDRVALVLGNNDYKFAPKLTNPVNDAKGIAAALRSGGFEVIDAYNVGAQQLQDTLDTFAKKVVSARIGLIYFAGHGIQFQGNAYLVPIDVDLSDERDVRKTMSSDYFMRDASRASELGIVILDACRDNPFVKQIAESAGPSRSLDLGRGLSKVNGLPKKSLIGYATQAGNVALDGDGANSPFATALMKYLPTPNKDIRLVFGAVRDDVLKATDGKQEPYIYGSLGGDEVYLVPAASRPAVSSSTQPVPPTPAAAPRVVPAVLSIPNNTGAISGDYFAWRSALEQNDWDAVQSIKASSGNGIFSLLADFLIAQQAPGVLPRAALARLQTNPLNLAQLPRNGLVAIQRSLRDLNFYGGDIDGTPSASTVSAFRQFTRSESGTENIAIASLVALGERASTRDSLSELTGTWSGRYEYPDRRPGVNFDMNLIFSQGKISGSIIEPNTFGKPTAKNLYANFSGSVTGDQIQWVKKYDGTGGVSHSVSYSGKLDRVNHRVVGTWTIKNFSGTFQLALSR